MKLPIKKILRKVGDIIADTIDNHPNNHNKHQTKNNKKNNPGTSNTIHQAPRSQFNGQPSALALPLPVPVPPLHCPPWFVIKSGFGHNLASVVSLTETPSNSNDAFQQEKQLTALRVTYKAGSVGSASGFGFYASPQTIFPALDAALSYSVYFPPNYNWAKGGKLPGLYIGSPGASGGNWDAMSGSARVVWKEGGRAAAYLYVPTCICGGHHDKVVQTLGPEYASIAHATKAKGHHVWKSGAASFKAGAWNTVHMRVRMNTPGQRDGLLELIVNGVSQSFEHMLWRTDDCLSIGGVCFVTFFGGSSPEAAAPPGAYKLFKDISVSRYM